MPALAKLTCACTWYVLVEVPGSRQPPWDGACPKCGTNAWRWDGVEALSPIAAVRAALPEHEVISPWEDAIVAVQRRRSPKKR